VLGARQRSQLGHHDAHDPSSLRRLSLPPLVYDGGLGEHNNLNLHMEHMPTQLPREQHHELSIQSRRHMSAADLTQVNSLVRGASDWAVGQPPRTIKDEERPTAAESSLYMEAMHCKRLHAVVQAIVLELGVLDNEPDSAGSPPDWSTKVKTIDGSETS